MSERTGGSSPYDAGSDVNPYGPYGADLSDPRCHTDAVGPEHHDHAGEPAAGGHGGHGWMMMICCIPMLLIAVGLMITGAASPGILVPAILCTLMMALMMRAMPGGGHGNH